MKCRNDKVKGKWQWTEKQLGPLGAKPTISTLCFRCTTSCATAAAVPTSTFFIIYVFLIDLTRRVLASATHGDGRRCGTSFWPSHIVGELQGIALIALGINNSGASLQAYLLSLYIKLRALNMMKSVWFILGIYFLSFFQTWLVYYYSTTLCFWAMPFFSQTFFMNWA